MWPRLVILLALTFPAELLATKIARVSIDALANEADRIALITLTAGELAKADNDCGVLYRGVVVDPVKNLQTGQTIAFFSRFDDQSGLRIGQQFIVFLNKLDVRSPCRGADLELAHAGFSAFWVGAPYRIDPGAERVAKIPQSFVAVPERFRGQPGHSSDLEISETIWVDGDDLLAYLKANSK